MKVFGSLYHLLVDHQTWGLNHQTWGSTLLYRTKFHGHVYPITILVVVGCHMCNGQNMECFLMKGNGHPIIDRELYTRCSHPTCYTCLLRRGLVLQAFFHCPVSWFWPIRFSCLNYTWCIPVFLALSTTVVSEPWKNTEVFVALLSGRSCRCTWALCVDDPRNNCWPSVEKNQPPKSKSTLVFNGFSKHWDRGCHRWYTMVKYLLIRPVDRQHSIA